MLSPSPGPGRDSPPSAGAAGRIIAVDPGSQLTGIIMGAFMSYVLAPREEGGTRLLLKIIVQPRRLTALALSVGDLVMVRRQSSWPASAPNVMIEARQGCPFIRCKDETL